MKLGLRLFLGFFLITGLAAFFVMRVFVNEVKPGVRQAMESTLVDAANVLAEMAAATPEARAIPERSRSSPSLTSVSAVAPWLWGCPSSAEASPSTAPSPTAP